MNFRRKDRKDWWDRKEKKWNKKNLLEHPNTSYRFATPITNTKNFFFRTTLKEGQLIACEYSLLSKIIKQIRIYLVICSYSMCHHCHQSSPPFSINPFQHFTADMKDIISSHTISRFFEAIYQISLVVSVSNFGITVHFLFQFISLPRLVIFNLFWLGVISHSLYIYFTPSSSIIHANELKI